MRYFLSLTIFTLFYIFPASCFCQTSHPESTQLFEIIKSNYARAEKLKKMFPDSAIYYYQNGLQLLENLSNTNSKPEDMDSLNIFKVNFLTEIGRVFHQQSKYSFATDYYQKALTAAKTVENDSILGECYFNIAEISLENGSYITAINSYTEALDLWKKINFIDGVFWTHIGLGIIYRETGNTERSKHHYENARQLGEKHNNEIYIGTCNNNIGNLYRQTGDYENAINYLQKALVSFKKVKNERYVSNCLCNIGTVYLEYGDAKRAIEYYREAITIAEVLNDKYRLLKFYANMGNACSTVDEKDRALMYFSKTLELAQAIGDKARLSEIYVVISDFYKKHNDYKNALANLNKSLIISKETGDSVSIAMGLTSVAQLYYSSGKTNKAFTFAKEAFDIAQRRGFLKTMQESASCLTKIYEKQNNYKEAYKYSLISSAAKDSLLNSEKIKILEETQAKYNLERVEAEKLKAENEALLADKKIRDRNLLIGILGIILFIFVILFARYFYKKRNEKKEAKARSAQLAKRIDLLNSQLGAKNRELTSKAMMISQNNKVIQEIAEAIDNCLNGGADEKTELRKLQSHLRNTVQESSWNDFLKHFQQVHPGFYKKLTEKYSDLSSNEQKICAFLRMNLNSKEIARITGQSVKSIEVARTRIRKKLGIDRTENLTAVIQKI